MARRTPAAAGAGTQGNAGRSVILSVFMEGTGNPLDPVVTQIALFSDMCVAMKLPEEVDQDTSFAAGHYKLSFPGCGVSHGLSGTLFATGLREQCSVVHEYIQEFIKQGHSVLVNFLGLSRGGIGGLYLAQTLSEFPPQQVLLNMLLYDPVPGNLIWMSRFLDFAGKMNANQAMDVSDVENLGRVLVLYPHEPLPDIAFHAPLLPKFPPNCDLEQEVILGCHQGALWLRPKVDTCLSFFRIREFLESCGTKFTFNRQQAQRLEVSKDRLADMLTEEASSSVPTTRSMHSFNPGMKVVRRSHGRYLNATHKRLLQQSGSATDDGSPYILDFEDE
eukprot:TRINITY_DN24134_c0_g2_i1.p1 TRINITY_DN24134_c0_g2~~TRINITY_DN24134_c0_g2_i1.p1  ORF type:complete len:333 (+),score=55.65 TRINITY_DN24134_c0_g2_i1:34-1032(+)